MRRAVPYLGRFLSKFSFEILAAVLVSVTAGYLLSTFHLGRAPDGAPQGAALVEPSDDDLTGEQRRELTRQILKARRENPETPEMVRPTPAKDAPTDAIEPNAPALAEGDTARAGVAAVSPPRTTVALPRSRPDTAPQAAGEPTPLSPVVVTASVPLDAQPEPRGLAAKVFSNISVFAGHAANATGDTVNWVIDLPGKVISAGGRLLGGDSTSAPAQKRNYL